MEQVYSKTVAILVVILIGYRMKRTGKIREEETRFLSGAALRLTLPCVIVKSLANITISEDILAAAMIGVAANLTLLLAALAAGKGKSVEEKEERLFSSTTFNITNYALPILSAFVGADVLAGVLAFNLPTSIFTYALVPSCGSILSANRGKNILKIAAKKILHSTPTMACIGMFVLAGLHIRVPAALLQMVSPMAEANTFLAMLAIGSIMELPSNRTEVYHNGQLICLRLGVTIVMAAIVYQAAPVGMELKTALVMSLFSPPASSCPMLAYDCGYQGSRVATANSVYMLISVVILTVLTTILR